MGNVHRNPPCACASSESQARGAERNLARALSYRMRARDLRAPIFREVPRAVYWIKVECKLTDAERRRVRASERDAARDRLHGTQRHFAAPLVVARVDELDRAFDHFEQRDVAGRTDLQRA